MTRHVVTAPKLTVAGIDLSDRVTRATVEETAGDVTSFASGDDYTQYHPGGPKTGTLDIEWIADYAADEVYRTLEPLRGTVASVQVSAGPATEFDEFDLDCLVVQVPFVTGTVGELSTQSTSWRFTEPTVTKPVTLIWSTAMRVGSHSTSKGFNTEGSSDYGRLNDERVRNIPIDVNGGANTGRLRTLRLTESTDTIRVMGSTESQANALEGLWVRIDNDDDLTVGPLPMAGSNRIMDVSGATGTLTTHALVPVGFYAYGDPSGQPDIVLTPTKLAELVMTCGSDGTEVGYDGHLSTGYGSLSPANFEWVDDGADDLGFNGATAQIYKDGATVRIRANSSAVAARMDRMWVVMSGGFKHEVRSQSGSSVLQIQGTVSDPGWVDGDLVTVQLWDSDPG